MTYIERQSKELLIELETGMITEDECWEYYKDLLNEVSEFYQLEYEASHHK